MLWFKRTKNSTGRHTIALCLLGALLMSGSVGADSKDYTAAKAVIEQIFDKLKKELVALKEKGNLSDDDYYVIAEKLITYIDTNAMGKLALGKKYWKQMSSSQQQRFLQGFRFMIISTYAKQAALLNNARFKFIAPDPATKKSRYVFVATKVLLQNKAPLNVRYVLKQSSKEWKIFDFIIDEVSMVRQFRKNFDAEIQTTSINDLVQRINGFQMRVKSSQP